MTRIIFLLFLFSTTIVLSQDSISNPILNVHNRYTKNTFTIKWPLKNFESLSSYSIYYEKNFISEETFKQIVKLEPNQNKKHDLFMSYESVGKNEQRTKFAFWSGAFLMAAGCIIAFDGLYGRYKDYEIREAVAGSVFLTGVVCEVIAVVFNKKRKKAVQKTVVILNS